MRSAGFAAIELPVKRKRSFDSELFEESTDYVVNTHQDQQNALGVIGCALRVAALADENDGVGRRRRHTLARASPFRWMTRGSRLPLDCCERARGSVAWQRSLRTDAVRRRSPQARERGIGMEVMFDRVAGLDVGKETLT